jgi:ceramide glucosyltransferase
MVEAELGAHAEVYRANGEDDDEEIEPDYHPPATVIVPVKGVDHDLARNLVSLADQDYPDYELIIAARSETDGGLLAAQTVLGARARTVVAGQPPEGTGEKVANLIAAVARARPESEVFVFADSDGQVQPGWLGNLVNGLRGEDIGAATGFRWHFPEDGGFWPLLRSAWDSTIAGSMSPGGKNFAWGGATAIRRSTFDEARVIDFWKGTISDDYRLTTALQKSGWGIRFVPGAMVATTGSCTAREFLDWAARQLLITRVYRGKLWLAGFVSHIIYCGAMLMSVAIGATGNPLGLAGFVLTVLPGMAKGGMRGYAARLMFADREEWLDRHGWAYFWLTPIATWVWLYAFARSAVTRRIEWRGNVYELLSAEQTRCVSGHTASKSPDR